LRLSKHKPSSPGNISAKGIERSGNHSPIWSVL
jgi:hypothetical protein